MKYILAVLLCLSFQAQAEYVDLDNADVITQGWCKQIVVYKCVLVVKDKLLYMVAFNQKWEEVAIWSVKEIKDGYEEQERILLWSAEAI